MLLGTMLRRRTQSIAPLLISAAAALTLSGCQKALFTDRDTRSQYDRYDRVRNQYEPPYLFDEFGAEVPNIRGRLTPK